MDFTLASVFVSNSLVTTPKKFNCMYFDSKLSILTWDSSRSSRHALFDKNGSVKLTLAMTLEALASNWIFFYFRTFGLHSLNSRYAGLYQVFLALVLISTLVFSLYNMFVVFGITSTLDFVSVFESKRIFFFKVETFIHFFQSLSAHHRFWPFCVFLLRDTNGRLKLSNRSSKSTEYCWISWKSSSITWETTKIL